MHHCSHQVPTRHHLQQPMLVMTVPRVHQHAKPVFRHQNGARLPWPVAAGGDNQWTGDERQLLWSATSRALLKLGAGGVQESHCRNLKSLLQAHTLVKVQLNSDPSGIQSLAEQLAACANAQLLGVNKRNMLFAPGSASKEQVLQQAKAASERIQAFHQKKLAAKELAEQQRQEAEDGPSTGGGTAAGRSKPRGGADNAKLDALIMRTVGKGPMTRDSLKAEWNNLSQMFTDGVADAEEQMRKMRTGKWEGGGTPGAFGRGGRSGGRGGRGGRGAGGRGGGGRGGGRGRPGRG